jgi:anaerobic magnesium-protoporphyrin IX monomethyl ester cyclase
MRDRPVVFFTINDYDNLGVGYMASVLSVEGFKTEIIDPREKKSVILDLLKSSDPLLAGFSIIFHNHIDLFIDLIDFLRKEGVNCHFTAGGHYASLKYNELFKIIPQLDSIVRFEGEYPLLELCLCIEKGQEWRRIKGIAFKEKSNMKINLVWPLERELDKFPFPSRSPLKNYGFSKKFTTIIAGRGCIHNCSFCNTREFYRQASGPVKRIRKPKAVVSEMEYLFHEKECSVFLFHDDDFPIKSSAGSDWLDMFCRELERSGLNRNIIWKINCRPDDVEEESFIRMKKNGLFLVFLGIEDGTDTGLEKLNKNMTVARSVEGVNILKKLGIGFDYGFMLFQPVTKHRSLIENLDFLREICGDGYTPVTFLKLLPLYETRVEKELSKAGRLNYTNGIGDYEFIEESMNQYYKFITESLAKWLRDPYGVENIAKWTRNYFLVFFHYFDTNDRVMKLYYDFNKIISESNLYLLDNMKELSEIFESGKYLDKPEILETYRDDISSKHKMFLADIQSIAKQLLAQKQNSEVA